MPSRHASSRIPARAAPAVALCLALALLPAASGAALFLPQPTTIRVEWGGEEIPFVTPMAGWTLHREKQVGCAGTVQVSFPTGAMMTVMGAVLGEEACSTDAPPCAPYDALAPAGVACASSNLACCTPFVVRDPTVNATTLDLGCLSPFWIVTEYHDHREDDRVGPFYALGPCDGDAAS